MFWASAEALRVHVREAEEYKIRRQTLAPPEDQWKVDDIQILSHHDPGDMQCKGAKEDYRDGRIPEVDLCSVFSNDIYRLLSGR